MRGGGIAHASLCERGLMGLAEFAGWLATQVFDVVGSFAGVQGADGGATVDLQASLAARKQQRFCAPALVAAVQTNQCHAPNRFRLDKKEPVCRRQRAHHACRSARPASTMCPSR